MEEEEFRETEKILMFLKYLEHQTCLLEVVEVVVVEVETQKEFLVNLIFFDAYYELWPDLLEVDPNGHDLLTSPVLYRGSCDLHGFCRTYFPTFIVEESLSCQLPSGGGGRVVVVVTVVVVAVDVGSRA
ncbi:hypothetical protein Tco_0282833 [Tanacetum coccineum]